MVYRCAGVGRLLLRAKAQRDGPMSSRLSLHGYAHLPYVLRAMCAWPFRSSRSMHCPVSLSCVFLRLWLCGYPRLWLCGYPVPCLSPYPRLWAVVASLAGRNAACPSALYPVVR